MGTRASALFLLVVVTIIIGMGSRIGAPRPAVDLSVATLNGAVLVYDRERASILVQSVDSTDRWHEVRIGGPRDAAVLFNDGIAVGFEPSAGEALGFLPVGSVQSGDFFSFCSSEPMKAAMIKIQARSPSSGVTGEASYMMRIPRPC